MYALIGFHIALQCKRSHLLDTKHPKFTESGTPSGFETHEVRNRDITNPTKRADVLQIFLIKFIFTTPSITRLGLSEATAPLLDFS